MKIGYIAGAVAAMAWFAACARAPEAAAPAASSKQGTSATVPAAEAEDAPATPAPAPAPQGLSEGSAKSSAAEAEFANLEAAERALDQAKADLDRLAIAEPSPVVGRSAAAGRAPAKEERKGKQPPSAGAEASSGPNSLCENTCRAYSSLSRAASAVCRLDGSAGTHCTRAKRVVRESQARVASCSCPAVGG